MPYPPSALATMPANQLGPSGLARVVEAKDLLRRAGTCAHLIRLVGGRIVVNTRTGLLLDATKDQQITVNCGNRRTTACPYCSTLYKYDTYNLIAAGLRGGKDTTPAVAGHPRLFVTVTAPSFGPVHQGPDKKTGHTKACTPRRDGTGCHRHHKDGDKLIGTPLHPDTYDYPGHVLFNAHAAALWSHTLTEVRRALARHLGVTRRTLHHHLTVQFAKVAEYQARGIIHFHAIARLDGPTGPGSNPPPGVTAAVLEHAIREAVAHTRVTCPPAAQLELTARTLGWGNQVDIRPIHPRDLSQSGAVSDIAVARYIAKYATKSTESAGLTLPPLWCRPCQGTGRTAHHLPSHPDLHIPCQECRGTGQITDLDGWHLTNHARRLIDTCWHLGAAPELAHLKLRRWAHMLGFRGHFATKSRTYSTTLAALRAERATFTANQDPHTHAAAQNPNILIINHWTYAGHDTPIPPTTEPAPNSPTTTARAAP